MNVMAHVLNKPYAQILAEFKDPVSSRRFREDMAWTGDVKYHAGAHRAMKGGEELDLVISMPPNPSHLEAIDPVVEGMARAAGTDVKSGGTPTVLRVIAARPRWRWRGPCRSRESSRAMDGSRRLGA